MAAIGWGDVTALASGLSKVDAGWQMLVLAHVNSVLDVSLFGGESSSRTRMLRIFLAAHFGELETRRGGALAAGEIRTETIGVDSIKFEYHDSQWDMSSDGLEQTEYGRQYKGMISSSAARIGFVP